MQQDQRLWLLVSLKISGEATPEELEELELLLSLDQDLSKKVEILQAFWQTPGQISSEKAKDAFTRHFQKMNNAITDEPSLTPLSVEPTDTVWNGVNSDKKYYKLWWVVAAASVLFALFFWAGRENPTMKLPNNIVTTRPGSKTTINLPDGSKVWLNADSKLTYDVDFQDKTREVYLSGEAYFDIAKDETRPFIIHTQTVNLKVLGTAFNVRSYDNDRETETALVHGSVEVTLLNNPDKKIVLKPGEKLLVKNQPVANSSTTLVSNQSVDETPIAVLTNMHYFGEDSSLVETSWTKNELIFDRENLEKIALKIERWFNVKVTIKDDHLKEAEYTGVFENEELEEVLQALKMTGGFHYTRKNKEVIISH